MAKLYKLGPRRRQVDISPKQKIKKPVIEKKRRDHINRLIDNCKAFVLKYDPAHSSKLEKADILELTCELIRRLELELNSLSTGVFIDGYFLDGGTKRRMTIAGGSFLYNRKQTKQEIEKFRRDRMNISYEVMKEYVIKYFPNHTTKLEKADILELTVLLLEKLTAEKDRAFNDEAKRNMMVCSMLMRSGLPEAQKAAHDIMLNIRPPPGIQFPAGMPMHRPQMMMPPPVPGGPFGFMGFPGMGIPPPMMMPIHHQQQQQLMKQTQLLRPTPPTQNAVATPPMVKKEPEAEAHTSDEEIDIENVENQNDETFSDASTSGFSPGTKQEYFSSDDSGIADTTTPKMPKSKPASKKINFSIDSFLVS